MPEVTFRRRGEIMRALFDLLRNEPEGMRASDALAALAERLPPSAYESGEYASGGRRYEKVVRFTSIVFVKSGWMVKESGRWFVTDAGRAALTKHKDAEKFFQVAWEAYRQWKKAQPDDDEEEDLPDVGTTEIAGVTLEQAQDDAWKAIEHHLSTMPPYEFQELVASLLRGMGYHVGWVAPPGRDGGIDIIAFNDPLGTRPPRIKVQVKRQQNRVSPDGLRSFLALVGAEDVGIFVNTGGFTKDAAEQARADARRVTLIDMERLVQMWTENFGKLDEVARRRLPLQPVYFLAPPN